MVFGHRHRGGYTPPTSAVGKIIQCTYASFMFCAMGAWIYFAWLTLDPWFDLFALFFVSLVSMVLLLAMALMATLFYCTITGKMF